MAEVMENEVVEEIAEEEKTEQKEVKFVNPVLAWGLIIGELVLIAVITLIAILI